LLTSWFCHGVTAITDLFREIKEQCKLLSKMYLPFSSKSVVGLGKMIYVNLAG